jgi:hypothetical protein
MKRARMAILGGLIAAVGFSTAAWAGEGSGACTHVGKYSAPRTVSGDILVRVTGGLGITHLVVQDQSTGCRVYVLAESTDACTVGQRFDGIGRLKTEYKGEDYDATLSLGQDKGRCH